MSLFTILIITSSQAYRIPEGISYLTKTFTVMYLCIPNCKGDIYITQRARLLCIVDAKATNPGMTSTLLNSLEVSLAAF